jgi:hypothetical protein
VAKFADDQTHMQSVPRHVCDAHEARERHLRNVTAG